MSTNAGASCQSFAASLPPPQTPQPPTPTPIPDDPAHDELLSLGPTNGAELIYSRIESQQKNQAPFQSQRSNESAVCRRCHSRHGSRQVNPAQPHSQHLGRKTGGGRWNLAGTTEVTDHGHRHKVAEPSVLARHLFCFFSTSKRRQLAQQKCP